MAMGMSFKAKIPIAVRIVAADGTGDFDNIPDAIDDLPATGGKVYVKEGTYTLSSEILIEDDDITIEGSGFSTIINLGGNAINGFDVKACSRIFIKNMQFTNVALSGGIGFIKLDNVTWCTIEGNYFNDTDSKAILLDNTVQNAISEQILIQNNKMNVQLGISSEPNVTAAYYNKFIWITNNYVVGVVSYFVYTTSTRYINVIDNIAQTGTYLFYGEDGSSYNYISGNTGQAIYIEGNSDYNRINDNYCSGTITLAISGETVPDRTIISGNICNLITDAGTNTIKTNLNNVF